MKAHNESVQQRSMYHVKLCHPSVRQNNSGYPPRVNNTMNSIAHNIGVLKLMDPPNCSNP